MMRKYRERIWVALGLPHDFGVRDGRAETKLKTADATE